TNLTLVGQIPRPRLWHAEVSVLGHNREREIDAADPTRIVNVAEADRHGWLQRGIAAQEDRVAYAQTGQETSHAAAYDVLIVNPIREADARLECIPNVNVRIRFALATEEEVEITGLFDRDAPLPRIRKAISRNHHSVVPRAQITRCDSPRGRINLHRYARIVILRIKDQHVAPEAVVGLDDRVTHAGFSTPVQFVLPGTVAEPLVHLTAVGGVRPCAQFGVGVE